MLPDLPTNTPSTGNCTEEATLPEFFPSDGQALEQPSAQMPWPSIDVSQYQAIDKVIRNSAWPTYHLLSIDTQPTNKSLSPSGASSYSSSSPAVETSWPDSVNGCSPNGYMTGCSPDGYMTNCSPDGYLTGYSADEQHFNDAADSNAPCYQCSDCFEVFFSPRGLTRHKTFACIALQKNNWLGYTSHSPSIGRFECPVCDKTFHNSHRFKHHSRTHAHEIPFYCEPCRRYFRSRSGLIVHLKRGCCDIPQSESMSFKWQRH